MRIEHVEAASYRIPPVVPFEDATHVVTGLEYIVATVHTEDGSTGVGWSHTPGIGATAVEALINDYLANMLIGKNVQNIEGIWTFMHSQLHRCGTGGLNTFAIAAVDIALWDILGKHYDQPLYRLLGGAREEIPAYISGIDYGYSIEDLLDTVDSYIDAGYGAIKIKAGYDTIEENVERVRRVRERIGHRDLYIDLNQKWTAAHAIQVCSTLEPYHLGWIEEPISRDDIEGNRKFRQTIKSPLASGEHLYTKYQFVDFLRADAMDIVQADVGRVGGITEWMKIAHLADAFFRPMAPHFVMELSTSLLCAISNGMIVEDTKGGSFTEMGVLETPITVDSDGKARPLQVPGHGVVFDRAELEKYRIDVDELRGSNLQSSKQ